MVMGVHARQHHFMELHVRHMLPGLPPERSMVPGWTHNHKHHQQGAGHCPPPVPPMQHTTHVTFLPPAARPGALGCCCSEPLRTSGRRCRAYPSCRCTAVGGACLPAAAAPGRVVELQ